MKAIYLGLVLLLSVFLKVIAQTTVIIRPDSSNSNDVLLTHYYPNNGYPASTEIISEAWTCLGDPCNFRSLIKFDLSVIPSNATVLNAAISFYAHPNQINGNVAYGPTYGSYNLSFLRKVVSPWNTATVTWNTLPSYTILNQAILPTSTSNYQDYLNIDVLNMVQDMVADPSTNYGFLFQLDTEVIYNCMIFCSSEFSDSTKRPKLEVTYIDPSSINEHFNELNNVLVSPNPAGSTISVDFNLNKQALFRYEIADAKGQEILFANAGRFHAGKHRIFLNDEIKSIPNGIYCFRFWANSSIINKKIIIIR